MDFLKCKQCKGMIITSNPLNPPDGLCNPCRVAIKNDGEMGYNPNVRCPKCRHIFRPYGDDPELFEEGVNTIYCGECGHEYEVSTHIEWSFTSPAMITPIPEGEV